MIPHQSTQIIACVISALIALCCVSAIETRGQAGSNKSLQTKSASRLARSQSKEENEKARSLMEDGLGRADQRDWAGALDAFNQALAISPRYGDVYIAIGDTYMNMGKYKEAFTAYQQAISVTPSNPTAHYSLGAAYNDMAQYGDGFKHFVQAIRLDSNFAEAHYGIGYAYLKIDRFSDAAGYLRRAVQLSPEYVDAHLALGQAYIGIRDLKAAEKELKILTGLDASVASRLEKEFRAAHDAAALAERDVVKLPDRTNRDELSESAPAPGNKPIAQPPAQEKSPARPAAQTQSSSPLASVLKPRATVPRSDADVAIELSFWDSVKNSTIPEEFGAYLNKYPEGQFAELARIRMRALAAKVEPASETATAKSPSPPPANVSAPENVVKLGAQTATENGIAQQPKTQPSEELPAEDQLAKEQPTEQPATETPAVETPRADETRDVASSANNAASIQTTMESLRRLLPSAFSYQIRPVGEASGSGDSSVEVEINYEPLEFSGCTAKWREHNDTIWVSLADLDPEAVRVEPRTRRDTTFSIEVWNVSITAVNDKEAINEAKDGGNNVNRYNGLDLQYDRKEKAERLAEILRQAIRLCRK